MGRKNDITVNEKKGIVKLLSEGRTTLDIAKYLKRDHRTIKKLCGNITKQRTRTKTPRQFTSAIKVEVVLCFGQAFLMTNLWGRSESWKVSKWIRKTTLVFLLTTLSNGTTQLNQKLLMSSSLCMIMLWVTPPRKQRLFCKLMVLLETSFWTGIIIPDINPIGNLWSIAKNGLYSGGRQFSNNEQLWAKISDVCAGMSPSTMHKLRESVDNWLIEILLISLPYSILLTYKMTWQSFPFFFRKAPKDLFA